MKINEVSVMSGLSRGQIDQLISRHRIHLHAKPRFGAAREFTPADAFMIALAGQLRAMGVKNENISSAVASIMPRVDPDTFEQLEIYPDRAALEAAGEPVYALVAKNEQDEMATEFVRQSNLDKELRKLGRGAGIVVCASLIASTIERLEGGSYA
jgi:hypothetical protein